MWLFYAIGSAFFCRCDFDPGKMRDKEDGLYCGDGSAHGGSPYLFMDHGAYIGLL